MTSLTQSRLQTMRAGIDAKPPVHGRRVTYMRGCRCMLCRAANSRYEVARDKIRRHAGPDLLIPCDGARAHILQLRKQRVGYKSVAAAAGVAITTVAKILSGEKTRIRRSTNERLCAVTKEAIADKTLIPAYRTWQILDGLLMRGYTKTQLAAWLGYCGHPPSLQLNRKWVTAKNASKVQRLAARIERGEMERKA